MTGLRRHMPDDDFLAIGRGQNMLFGFRKAGSFGAVRVTVAESETASSAA